MQLMVILVMSRVDKCIQNPLELELYLSHFDPILSHTLKPIGLG